MAECSFFEYKLKLYNNISLQLMQNPVNINRAVFESLVLSALSNDEQKLLMKFLLIKLLSLDINIIIDAPKLKYLKQYLTAGEFEQCINPKNSRIEHMPSLIDTELDWDTNLSHLHKMVMDKTHFPKLIELNAIVLDLMKIITPMAYMVIQGSSRFLIQFNLDLDRGQE